MRNDGVHQCFHTWPLPRQDASHLLRACLSVASSVPFGLLFHLLEFIEASRDLQSFHKCSLVLVPRVKHHPNTEHTLQMNNIMDESKKQPIIFIIPRMRSPKKKLLVDEDSFSC